MEKHFRQVKGKMVESKEIRDLYPDGKDFFEEVKGDDPIRPDDHFGQPNSKPSAQFHGLSNMLRAAAGVEELEPVEIVPIDDEAEPFFIVRDIEQARELRAHLDIVPRWKAKQISTWYASNCIFTASEAECRKIVNGNFRAKDFLGSISWKPVVLTFKDPKFSATLSKMGLAITEIDGIPESYDVFSTTVAITSLLGETILPDLPSAALDGALGKICRERMSDLPLAFAWPALVAAASVLVSAPGQRTNLYVGLIGPVESGKTTAIRRALWLLGVQAPLLLEDKIGSGEGLGKRIGNIGDSPVLWFPDELGHLMSKAQISNATFCETLCSAWSQSNNDIVASRQQRIEFSCKLSIVGGLVTEQFGDAFGSAATGGLYDRFIFAEAPSDYTFMWRPDEGEPVRKATSRPEPVGVGEGEFDLSTSQAPDEHYIFEGFHSDVWPERDRWITEEQISPRVCENVLRVAAICAAFDAERGNVCAADLGPSLALARYQMMIRSLRKPNPGRNEAGIVFHRIKEYLERHSADEQWKERSRVLQDTNVYDFGPGLVDRTLAAMEQAGEIEQTKQGRKRMIRKLV